MHFHSDFWVIHARFLGNIGRLWGPTPPPSAAGDSSWATARGRQLVGGADPPSAPAVVLNVHPPH